MTKTAVIIGAGPAGLTAAHELLTTTDIVPIVIERGKQVGGISRTENWQGNRIDIGGHRFFSKSDKVMDWWSTHYPRMLERSRKSSIYYQHKLYDYPIELNPENLKKLGLVKTVKIGLSYIYAVIFPIKEVKSLEDFFVNRFGRELYATFFQNYTERLWGKPASKIDPEWGAQRIKSLSISTAILHYLKSLVGNSDDIRQKKTETSLINRFLYPPHGPGQLWEHIERQVIKLGGTVSKRTEVIELLHKRNKVVGVIVKDLATGKTRKITTDYVISTMPIDELGTAMKIRDKQIKKSTDGLIFRHFVTAGLLIKRPKHSNAKHIANFRDNWIYIHDPNSLVLRIQIFNNWSPAMVKNPKDTVWVGLEYTCSDRDFLWKGEEEEILDLAKGEMVKLGLISDMEEILGGTVIKTPKAYPAYFGTYKHFDKIRNYFDKFHNLFLVGRNGMHHYNNQDHSMLAAMAAVENIKNLVTTKDNLWSVNTEDEYHEEKTK